MMDEVLGYIAPHPARQDVQCPGMHQPKLGAGDRGGATPPRILRASAMSVIWKPGTTVFDTEEECDGDLHPDPWFVAWRLVLG